MGLSWTGDFESFSPVVAASESNLLIQILIPLETMKCSNIFWDGLSTEIRDIVIHLHINCDLFTSIFFVKWREEPVKNKEMFVRVCTLVTLDLILQFPQ